MYYLRWFGSKRIKTTVFVSSSISWGWKRMKRSKKKKSHQREKVGEERVERNKLKQWKGSEEGRSGGLTCTFNASRSRSRWRVVSREGVIIFADCSALELDVSLNLAFFRDTRLLTQDPSPVLPLQLHCIAYLPPLSSPQRPFLCVFGLLVLF